MPVTLLLLSHPGLVGTGQGCSSLPKLPHFNPGIMAVISYRAHPQARPPEKGLLLAGIWQEMLLTSIPVVL